MAKFLLLLGPSGVGKSTLMKDLFSLDSRFVYISPDTTRALRPGEVDKRSVTIQHMETLAQAGEYVFVNTLFDGIRYATPRRPILEAFSQGNFPVLDWPVDKIQVMKDHFPVFAVYLVPPTTEELKARICADGRDPQGIRYHCAVKELEAYTKGLFDSQIDLQVISYAGKTKDIATTIYQAFLKASNE